MGIDDIYDEFVFLLEAIDGNHLTVGDCNSAKLALASLRRMCSPEKILGECLVDYGKSFKK